MRGLQPVEWHVGVRMVLHVVGHLPGELAIEPPCRRGPGACPSVGVGVWAHLASAVLRELVHSQVPRPEAVRQEPEEHQLHTDARGVRERQQRQGGVARAEGASLDANEALRGRRLVRHPWVQREPANSQAVHAMDALEAEGVAAQESSVGSRGARGVLEVQALTAQLWVLHGIVREAVVRPVEAPEPLGASEVEEAKDFCEDGVQSLCAEGSVVHHLVEAVEEEGLRYAEGELNQQE
mmetsp:Transcript_42519/g.118387  ORF Transcript_42519/g.118387 Transcript_42519/m.118387 type:complete len:238 (-) Transcript_42519:308-1021(-)